MKILYVAHEGKMGGASKSLGVLAKHMADRGHDVTILMPFKKGELQEELKQYPQIHTISMFYTWWQYPARAGKTTSMAFIIGYSVNWIAKLRLFHKFCRKDFDIVHSNSSVINVGAWISRITGAKHVWHFREFGEPDLGTKYILGLKRSMRYVNRHTDKVIYISRAIQNYYGQWLKKSLGTVIYNGIGRDYEQVKQQKDYCRNGKVHFLISGALQKGKGQECVIEAAALLEKRGIADYDVIIAGRDINQYQAVLKQMVQSIKLEKKVHFAGFVRDMTELRRKTDVELVCSDREAFGRVTIEAMMASNPVIASDGGANPELVRQNENGMLFPCGEPEALADSMEYFIKHQSKVWEMGQKAHDFAASGFSSDKNADLIEKLYLKLTEQERALF